jgi:hypothetical protein
MQLLGVQLIETAVKAAILTGRVANSDTGPLSLMLIAAPESGKTSVVAKDCKSTISFSDVTGRGLTEATKSHPEVSHFIILDMVAIMSHRQTVNNYTIAILNALTEEGLGTIAYPGSVEKFPNGKRGVIACLTRSLAKDGRSWWNKTGFATRMLPLCFDHSPALSIQIKQSITSGFSRPDEPAFKVPDASVNVTLQKDEATQIQLLADMKAIEFQEKGYRRLKQFRALAKGHALLRSWRRPIVCKADLDFLRNIMPFISFDKAQQI